MTASERDAQRAAWMVRYCDEVAQYVHEYNMSEETFEATRFYQLAINNLLAQIGELSGRLSPDFRKSVHDDLGYWRDIRGFRNIATHDYERLEPRACYEFATQDVPRLRGLLIQGSSVSQAYDALCDQVHFNEEDPLMPLDVPEFHGEG